MTDWFLTPQQAELRSEVMELLVPFSVLQELVVVLVEADQIQEEVVAGSQRLVVMA